MGMGPFLTYDDDTDLERHLLNIRDHGIRITELPIDVNSPVGNREFRFQRGFGAVHGFAFRERGERCVHLGCDHPLNPFYWWPDMRLLSKIESIMIAAGSRRM
jgi:hypothetical protein